MNPLSLASWTAACFLATSLFAHTVALRLALLAITVALLGFASAKSTSTLRAVPPLWLPFALWTAWAVLSLAWSIEPERSLKELRNEILYVALAFWACFVAAQARHAARVFLPLLGAACVALCANAVYAFARGAEPWAGGPGNLSSTVLLLMPCSVAAAWYARQAAWPAAYRAAPVALAAILLAAAYAAQSRTLWLALAAQTVCAAVLVTMRPGASSLARRATTAALFATAVVLAAASMTLHVQSAREMAGAGMMDRDPRLALWTEVVEKIGESPFTGYGFGRGMLRIDLRNELKEAQLWHAHNLFLDTALQLGLPGVALLLALLAATLREGWRMARGAAPEAAACGVVLITVVVGMLVRNMTDVLLVRQNALLYWGVVGVLLAWGAGPRAAAR